MNGFHFNLVIPSRKILRGQVLYVIVNYVVSFILNVKTKQVFPAGTVVRWSYVVSVLKSDFVGNFRALVKSATQLI